MNELWLDVVIKWKSNRSSAAILSLKSWFFNVQLCLFFFDFCFFPRFYFFPNKMSQFKKIRHRSIELDLLAFNEPGSGGL